MAQLPMYAAMINSPGTELAADITATATSIDVLDASKLPAAPNLITVGGDETAETILYTGKTGNTLTGCTRGFEGSAKGWAAGTPAARNHTAYDYEAGRANIADVSTRVDNIVIPDASLMEKGIVQLSDATDGTRDNVAATEKAVGLAFQAGVERKAEVVAALNSIGVSASTSESWEQLIPKIAAVIRATGTATAAQVLAGATFSNATGNGRTGTMANQGAGGTVTPGTANQTKAAGYYSSAITVLGDADLIPGNIKSGVNIFGVDGNVTPGKRSANGQATSSTSTFPLADTFGVSKSKYLLKFTGLTFTPNRVVLRKITGQTNQVETCTVYNSPFSTQYNNVAFDTYYYGSSGQYVGQLLRLGTGEFFLNDTGFGLPVEFGGVIYEWDAFEV
ncbi:phage tail protein [Paenibacillus xylanilyticus]|uniref:phage tail protein n=1 Tax=Paenibacillus xylanilyticus TaxID=248903 RepID=UPI003AAD00CD